MERRVTSHTEEEEMNQRRHLLTLARKGDSKAIHQLKELYQVRVYSGDKLKSLKMRQSLQVPTPSKYGPVAKKHASKTMPRATPSKRSKTATPRTKSQSPKLIGAKGTKNTPKGPPPKGSKTATPRTKPPSPKLSGAKGTKNTPKGTPPKGSKTATSRTKPPSPKLSRAKKTKSNS